MYVFRGKPSLGAPGIITYKTHGVAKILKGFKAWMVKGVFRE